MGIEMDKPPRDMSLAELAERCMSEINKYSRKEPHNDQYCLEIFRRAMLQGNAQAWELLIHRFHGTVLGWVRRHPNKEAAIRLDSEENYVALAFERFWRVTVRNKSLEFNTLAGALVFLRACVNCAMIDTLRSQRDLPLPEGIEERPAPEPDGGAYRWEIIKSFLNNAREQRLAYLLYYCGLKPRQIVKFVPDEFRDVEEIFRLTRNIIDRLRRNKDRLRWLLGDEEF